MCLEFELDPNVIFLPCRVGLNFLLLFSVLFLVGGVVLITRRYDQLDITFIDNQLFPWYYEEMGVVVKLVRITWIDNTTKAHCCQFDVPL